MEPLKRISEEDEAELRVMTLRMYEEGGMENVLDCLDTIYHVQEIILDKLDELIHEKHK